MNKKLTTLLAITLLTASHYASASAIALFGDYTSSKSSLNTKLVGMGHTVTVLGDNITGSLSGYDSIWGVNAFDPLSASEMSLLSDYVSSGGGLYLTGERPCCEVLNSSLTTFVNSIVDGGSIQIGGLGDKGSISTINSSVVGNLASAPNTVTSWSPRVSGGISGVTGDNVFAYTPDDSVVAAAWDMDDLINDAGRLVVMMDVNWLGTSQNDLLENIEVFLSGASVITKKAPVVAASAPGNLLLVSFGLAGLLSLRRRKA